METRLSEEDLIDLWLVPKYNISIKEVIKKYPRECAEGTWFYLFPVTQAEYDIWYDRAIEMIRKKTRFKKEYIERKFSFTSLNVAPYVEES